MIKYFPFFLILAGCLDYTYETKQGVKINDVINSGFTKLDFELAIDHIQNAHFEYNFDWDDLYIEVVDDSWRCVERRKVEYECGYGAVCTEDVCEQWEDVGGWYDYRTLKRDIIQIESKNIESCLGYSSLVHEIEHFRWKGTKKMRKFHQETKLPDVREGDGPSHKWPFNYDRIDNINKNLVQILSGCDFTITDHAQHNCRD